MDEYPYYDEENPDKTVIKAAEELSYATAKNFVSISFVKDNKPTVFDSKLGGLPYSPSDFILPTNPEGLPMCLLCQINFDQVPTGVLEGFPSSGILQWFVCPNDLYGCDFDNPNNQDTFRVVYHPDVDTSVTEEAASSRYLFDMDADASELPIDSKKSFKIKLTPRRGSMTTSSSEYTNLYCETYNKLVPPEHHITDFNDDIFEVLYDLNRSDLPQCHIGGYPFFTQDDPHNEDCDTPYSDKHTVLIQLDSDDSVDMMWGDSGVAQLWINQEKLKNLDFSDVCFNYDCY